jgi:hypothetical protein
VTEKVIVFTPDGWALVSRDGASTVYLLSGHLSLESLLLEAFSTHNLNWPVAFKLMEGQP